jgi:putative hemolysin
VTWVALAMALVGLLLSALFSGSETGFYRATRLRLVLDSLSGDRVSRGLLWLTNHPSLFVATTLVGNNLANYLTSLAIVLGAHSLSGGRSPLVELLAPLLLSPLLFVYGELLPKALFLQAPNRLLHRVGPAFLVFLVLFFPVSLVLWGVNLLLARLVGRLPEEVRSTLARRELRRALEEGREAGVLHPAQQALARGILNVGRRPVGQSAVAVGEVPRARADMSRDEVLRLAAQGRVSAVPVESSDEPGKLVGYVRVIDLALGGSDRLDACRPLPDISESLPHLAALVQLQAAGESLARVIDARGNAVGLVSVEQLREPLLQRGGETAS